MESYLIPSIVVGNSLNLSEEEYATRLVISAQKPTNCCDIGIGSIRIQPERLHRAHNQPTAGTSGNGPSMSKPFQVDKKGCLLEEIVTVTRPTPDNVLFDINEFDLELHNTGRSKDSFEDVVITK